MREKKGNGQGGLVIRRNGKPPRLALPSPRRSGRVATDFMQSHVRKGWVYFILFQIMSFMVGEAAKTKTSHSYPTSGCLVCPSIYTRIGKEKKRTEKNSIPIPFERMSGAQKAQLRIRSSRPFPSHFHLRCAPSLVSI